MTRSRKEPTDTRRPRSISNAAFFYYYRHVNELIATICEFLNSIGIGVSDGEVSDGESFLPGIEVKDGSLILDRSRLKYPGDLLHEAAHLAVVPSEIRSSMSGEVNTPDGEPNSIELMAMLWSYAASLQLELNPRVVFHEGGYRGKSNQLLFNFEHGVFIGVQGLERVGMTLSPSEAELSGREPFPVMQKWLRA
ncbi:MAG TPA: hypothetical protein VJV05_17960 [Pyrinomonadaceae bacterium]|nr:hypothetical protein [Pyrinomonadaceae bacterium]